MLLLSGPTSTFRAVHFSGTSRGGAKVGDVKFHVFAVGKTSCNLITQVELDYETGLQCKRRAKSLSLLTIDPSVTTSCVGDTLGS